MNQLQQPAQAAVDGAEDIRIAGEHLRRLRKANGISLRQLAQATGTSASFISQFERGLTGASAATLIRIADCFGTNIAELFSGADRQSGAVLRRAERPALPFTCGQRKTLLSRRPFTHFEVYSAEFQPGGSSGDQPYTHGDSHEMLLVLRGRVRLELGGEAHDLDRGDCAEYATSVPHRVVNVGAGTAEVLYLIAPPTSTASTLDARRKPDG